ncbi:rhomboid family intramembrane serine protease [Rhodopirellula sp.]|nr:rhomboid family intramembrane serine protease [Rhodopirellula sp.]MDB4331627.1 rhomboid family intramembrane serine protease [bacterium]MDB4678717.1 rhomboid family intramembrane serine protease [Rhodopirellula sp.]MDC0295451.1 rhomboid family intramembrane serine protease [bacterium]
MRQLGTLESKATAKQFYAYLLQKKIDAVLEFDPSSTPVTWILWIRSEDDLDYARSEWREFQVTPDDPRFVPTDQEIIDAIEQISSFDEKHPAQMDSDRSIDMNRSMEDAESLHQNAFSDGDLDQDQTEPVHPESRSRDSATHPPVQFTDVASIRATILIIAISMLASFVSHFGNPRGSRDTNQVTLEQKVYRNLSFVDPEQYEVSRDPMASVRQGQLWRLITPLFLHADELQLAFNVMWLFFLGSTIEKIQGSWFLMGLILFTQTCGMLLQVALPVDSVMPSALQGSPFAIGSAGAVYGLFGYLWARPFFSPDYPVYLVPANVILMLLWLALCMTSAMAPISIGAHLGGLVAGILSAFVVSKSNH